MDIGEIINDAIRYPSSNWSKVIILGVIFIASILIVPIFLAMGYLFRILKATFAGIDELPDFDEIGSMFVDGLKIFVVGLVYSIPLYVIIFLMMAILGFNTTNYVYTGFENVNWGFYAFYIVYFIVAIIIGLIEYIGIANMALYEGDLGAAFKFSEIMERISKIGWGKYIVWYIVMILLGLVFYVISFATMIVLVGFILAPLIILPYFAIFGARSLALLFASGEEAA